jgi:amino acid adenylation domain-containing protein
MKNKEYLKESDHSKEKKELLALLLEEEGLNLDKPPVITPRKGGEVAPLSFAQQRLWFLNQLVTGSANNIYLAIRLKGLPNIKALEESLNEIIRRHEALRTTFRSNGGRPVQVIAENMLLEMPLIDLSGQPRAEREVEAERLTREEAMRRFDLVKGPLFNAALIRLSEEEHILLLTMHHIVSDGWSMGVFTAELAALYKAYCNGEASPLPELPIQYADFAHWQREWLQGEVLENQLSYWRKQLEGVPVLQLPTDHPRPAVQTYRGASQSLILSATLTEALNALSRAEGATLFMTLLAAFNTLLYRHTGQEDIVVGSPIANRNRAEIEGLIGFFVNSLVMRTDLSGNPTFRELIRRVQNVALGAYEHQDLPFEKLVEEMHPERDMSHTPLFQVMFNMINVRDIAVELHNLSVERVPSVESESRFDFTLHVMEIASDIELRLVYNTDLFDSWRMAEMLKQYQMLLASIVSDPDQRIGELPLMREKEREEVTNMGYGPKSKYPKDQCIQEAFARQVIQNSQAVAVVLEDQSLTYHELNTRANQLAHYLQRHGVGPEVRVGLCLNRSIEMIVAVLGILKAEGAYVPMDPNYPPERLAFMTKVADLRVILTQEEFQEPLSHLGGEHIHLDADWPVIGQEKESTPVSQESADSLAYVLFTSGSTGRPKGVEVEHRQVLNYVDGILEKLKLPTGASFAMVSPLTADLGNTMLYPALATGGTLHIISEDRAADPVALGAYFKHHQPDCLKVVPSHLATLLMGPTPAEILPQKRLVVGGEACPWQLVEKVQALKPGCRVINHYGPTETTVGVTTHQVEATDRTTSHSPSVPIGQPLPNSQLYILDSHQNPVPLGVAGEVYIGGRGLARGYAGAPEQTAEKFVPHPYSEEPGARLYKTGDRAKFQSNGTIEFLGRIDHQVKLRGFRIELGEIETVLNQHKRVQSAVVVVREKEGREKQLVAYVVPKQGQLFPSDLRQFLKQTLPGYMVPTIFVMLEDLPLTPNGKVDRRALPAPDLERSWLETKFVAPRTQVEKVLAKIWNEVLGLEGVGVHDNFFELGGHSLLATRVVSRIQQEFQVDLKLMDFFKMPTIAELSKGIEGLLWIDAGRPSDDEAEFQDKEEGVV